MNTLVLGLGNLLLGDDGVGVHAVRHMQQHAPGLPDAVFLDGGTLSFTLAGYIEETDHLIIIDAAQLNRAPGEIAIYQGDEMDRFVSGNRNKSVHEVTLSDVLALAHLSGQLPRRRALIGIQPRLIDWSDALSEPVARALPSVCRLTRELMLSWENDPRSADQPAMDPA